VGVYNSYGYIQPGLRHVYNHGRSLAHSSPGPFMNSDTKRSYEEHVDRLFSEGIWPNTVKIEGGDIIQGCWTKFFKTAYAVLQSQEALHAYNKIG